MTATLATHTPSEPARRGPAGSGHDRSPRLLDGIELLGQVAGSGFREAPFLVRRHDGQVVQLSQLLYEIAGGLDGRPLSEVADTVTARLQVRITPEQIAYAAEQKLAPLGLVPYRDGRIARSQARTALLALRFRAGILGETPVNAIARLMQPLFRAPVVLAALLALVACDVWLGISGGVSDGLIAIIRSPALILGMTALTILSLAFHECGHAAACRYSGARPGRIGVGIYLVWPVFFTDVTDSYRLPRRGRLRTDLGGVYFNVLVALATAGAYLATDWRPLVVAVVGQQLLILDQFVPWIRLDGYHIVSDLIGVPDLFERIRPVTRSLLPGRPRDPRVSELKPSARVAVSVWVLTTAAALGGLAVIVVVNAPHYLRQAWQSLVLQLGAIGTGGVIDVLNGAVGIFMLLLPVLGMTLTYLVICRGIGAALAVRRARPQGTSTIFPWVWPPSTWRKASRTRSSG
jgi:putative peptide zinc metalloprotease protein